MKFITIIIFLFSLISPLMADENQLVFILDQSGVLQESQYLAKLLHKFPEKKVARPFGLHPEIYSKYLANAIKNKLGQEEVNELYELFKSPFLAKVSQLYFSYTDFESDQYKQYILKEGPYANKDRVHELDNMNNLFLWSPKFIYSRKQVREIYLIQELLQQKISADNKNFSVQVRTLYTERYGHDEDRFNFHLTQGSYYKTKQLRYSEIAEFNRKYHQQKTLSKFYKIYLEAKKKYFYHIKRSLMGKAAPVQARDIASLKENQEL